MEKINPDKVENELISQFDKARQLIAQDIPKNVKEELQKLLDNKNHTDISLLDKSVDYKRWLIKLFGQEFAKIQSSDLPKQKLWINSKNQSEISRTVKIDWTEHKRTVSQLFATTKNFKNYIQPSDKFIQKRKQIEERLSKEKWSKFEFVDSKYILW